MADTNPKVDAIINSAKKWREEFKALRAIILECDLMEDVKWGQPCYTPGKSNIVLPAPFFFTQTIQNRRIAV